MSTALASLKDRHTMVASQLANASTRLMQVIPVSSGLAPARVIAVALDALSRNPKLLECDARSIVRSVIQAAEVGLEIGGPLGDAFIVPFWNKEKKSKEATMMIGYRGYARLIQGAPRVTAIKAVLVRANDTFEVDEGENRLTHKRGVGSKLQRGDVTYAYARVWYGPSESQFEVMDRVELDEIKAGVIKRLQPGMFTPWNDPTNADEMRRKCPIRRMAKTMDLTQLGRKALETESLNAMMRGEVPGADVREGFDGGRAQHLKDMLREQHEGKPTTIDAEFESE